METKKYQLPKEFATKWVEALRSGEYAQGKYKLKDESSCQYCCLGVAGEIVGVKEFGIKQFYNGDAHSIELEDGIMPAELYGTGADNNLVEELTEMNDSGGKTFAEISDWIEANVEFI